MTKWAEPKNEEKVSYESSRSWSERHLKVIKDIQDEYLDRYYDDTEESTAMLKILSQLVERLEKQL